MRSLSLPSLKRRSLKRRSVWLLAALALVLSACGQNDAQRQDMINALTEEAELTDEQANCIADIIYDGTWDQDQLNDAGSDPSSVPGFQDALDGAYKTCL